MGVYGVLLAAVLVTLWVTPTHQQVLTLQNKTCVFPFTWKGVEYNNCTTVDSFWNMEWCGLANMVTGWFDWGYCDDDNNGATVAPPPTTAGSGTGTGTTADPGCKVKTLDGRDCALPFEYQGMNFTTCTTANHNNLWCSTTPVYSGIWGECNTAMSTDDIACSMPFTYNNVEYHACTTVHHVVAWCSYDNVYVSGSGRWGECRLETC